jgi:hypothetical protein
VTREIRLRQSRGETLSPEALTNVVFKGGIAHARSLVVKYSASVEHLIFLCDNLDKGWAVNGVDQFDVRMLRLLIEAVDKVRRDLSSARRDFIAIIFLRNDVYELLVNETPDRGKTSLVRIDWTDRVKLRQVVHRRLQASTGEWKESFVDLWLRYFVPRVQRKDSFEYLVDHCLMRPRFLLNIIENAIANGINRSHNIVDEDDCIDAVKQHSNYLLSDFGYEIRDVSGLSSKLLNFLVGTTKHLTKGEVVDRFRERGINDDNLETAFRLMLWYGVLGVITENGAEKYIYDFEYLMDRLEAEILSQKDEPLYVTNAALHVALKTG